MYLYTYCVSLSIHIDHPFVFQAVPYLSEAVNRPQNSHRFCFEGILCILPNIYLQYPGTISQPVTGNLRFHKRTIKIFTPSYPSGKAPINLTETIYFAPPAFFCILLKISDYASHFFQTFHIYNYLYQDILNMLLFTTHG